MWDGHPSALDNSTIEKALKGALPKPLFEFPSNASGVRNALSKHNYALALAEAAKLSQTETGAELQRSIQGLISGSVANMKSALKEGDLLTAHEAASALKKDLAGLPEAQEAEKVLADIAAREDAERIMAAQKKIRGILEQKLGKRRDYEKAIEDLKKIMEDQRGSHAFKEAEEALATIGKRREATR